MTLRCWKYSSESGDARMTKVSMKRVLISFIVFMLLFNPLLSGQPKISLIKLKNKGQIKGVILEDTGKGIVVDLGYGTVAISNREIDFIEVLEEAKKEEELQNWRREKYTVELSGGEARAKHDLERHLERIKENQRIEEEKAERRRKSREYRVRYVDSSRIEVKVILNERIETSLFVDTGASAVLVPLETANLLGGFNPKTAKKIMLKMADGTVREGFSFVLRSVEIGGLRAENIPAVTMGLEGHSGLLGMSFLKNFNLIINPKKKELLIKEK